MSVVKIGEVDIQKCRNELDSFDLNHQQIPLQGRSVDDTDGATGKMSDLGAPEQYYTEFLHQQCPYINNIIKKYDMVRTRIMSLKQYSCYSYHQDGSARIHIPISTDHGCFIIINKIVYELPADGSVYMVDTTEFHTAINGSYTPNFIRTHIVGAYHGVE